MAYDALKDVENLPPRVDRKALLGDPPPVYITGQDFGRRDLLLTHLNAKTSSPLTLEFLRTELERAQLVDDEEIDTPFVQIGTHVLFADERGETYPVTLTVPESGDSPDHVSILASVGAALLGISQGHLISYETPDKRIKTLTVLEVSEHPPQRS